MEESSGIQMMICYIFDQFGNIRIGERLVDPWMGSITGYGGKRKPVDKTIVHTCRREVKEEGRVHIFLKDMELVAYFSLVYKNMPERIDELFVIFAYGYRGNFEQTAEMRPVEMPVESYRRSLSRIAPPGDNLWLSELLLRKRESDPLKLKGKICHDVPFGELKFVEFHPVDELKM
jgi:hypothetical protein